MKTGLFVFNGAAVASNIIALITFILIFSAFSAKKIPFLTGEAAKFFILFILGLSMSILSGSKHGIDSMNSMPKPVMASLSILGIASFIMLVATPLATRFGWRIPFMYGYMNGFTTLSIIIAAKFIITRSYYLMKLLK